MPPAKNSRKTKKGNGERAFYDELCTNPVPTTRITREAIDNKKNVSEVNFKFEAENVRVWLGSDREPRVSVELVSGKTKKELSGEDLPLLFRERMKYYLGNLGWSIDKIKALHEAKEGTFFDTLYVEGPLEQEIEVRCGWRGVLFYYVRKEKGHVCVFYPADGSIERLATLTVSEAEDLCYMLSDGLCFGCKTKIGPGKFCSYHHPIFRTYGA